MKTFTLVAVVAQDDGDSFELQTHELEAKNAKDAVRRCVELLEDDDEDAELFDVAVLAGSRKVTIFEERWWDDEGDDD